MLALVGGPLSLLYLWPMLVERDQRPPLSAAFGTEKMAERYAAVFTRDRLFAAVLLGTTTLITSIVLDPRLVFALVVGSILLIPVASGVISWGRIDPEEATMTYMDRPVPLSRVDEVKRLDIGEVAFCWLSYHRGGDDLTSPRWVVLSREAADSVERAVAEAEPDEEDAPNRALQTALAFFALCFLGLAGLLFVVEPGSAGDPTLRWYLVGTFGSVGAMFALAAVFAG